MSIWADEQKCSQCNKIPEKFKRLKIIICKDCKRLNLKIKRANENRDYHISKLAKNRPKLYLDYLKESQMKNHAFR